MSFYLLICLFSVRLGAVHTFAGAKLLLFSDIRKKKMIFFYFVT